MSDEIDPTINGRPISELKVVELKEELSKRGLSKAGNKNVLYDRLKKFLLDDTGDANVTAEFSDVSQVHDTPSSPPANPLVAEYLAKQEAALREARKDAEAALRSSSGDETSPSPKKVLRGRKSGGSSLETEENTLERRTTRSKTRSEIDQDHSLTKIAAKGLEAQLSPEKSSKGPDNKCPAVELEGQHTADDTRNHEKSENAGGSNSVSEKNESIEVVKQILDEMASDLREMPKGTDELKEQTGTTLKTESQVNETKSVAEMNKEEEDEKVVDMLTKDMTSWVSNGLHEGKGGEGDSNSNLLQNNKDSMEERGSRIDSRVIEVEEPVVSIESHDSGPATVSEVVKNGTEEDRNAATSGPETSQTESLLSLAEGSSATLKAIIDSNFEKATDAAKVERKRRWKETSSSQESNDKDVITISAAETKDVGLERDESENSEADDKPVSESAFEEKEAVLVGDDKDEELDYEEALEHASPASEASKNAKPEYEEMTKRLKLEEVEPSDTHAVFGSRREVLTKKNAVETAFNQQKKEGSPEDDVRRRKVSPARYPVSEYLLIRQLTRPFTVKQLKSMLGNYGTLVEDGFWIDSIKSKCIVKYSSKEEAIVARGSLHNLVWPVGNPKELKVDFIDEAGFERFSKPDLQKDVKDKASDGSSAQPSASLRISVGSEQRLVSKKAENQDNDNEIVHSNTNRDHSPRTRHESGHGRGSPVRREENVRTPVDRHKNEIEGKAKTADELFQKTKTQPAIYFAPLTEEQVMERAKQKNIETESPVVKRNTQTSRDERHKEEDSEKDGKYRFSPWRRPVAQKRRRPSRSRSPRRP